MFSLLETISDLWLLHDVNPVYVRNVELADNSGSVLGNLDCIWTILLNIPIWQHIVQATI